MTPSTLLFIALSTPPQYHYAPTWPPSLEPIVAYHADVNLVPRWLAWNVMMAESNGKPRAVGSVWERRHGRWVRGKTLAEGLFMISVEHRAYHVRKAGLVSFDPWNPGDSARVGLVFLGSLLRYFHGELRPSVAGFNAGRSRAESWYFEGRALPRETAAYVKIVLGGR